MAITSRSLHPVAPQRKPALPLFNRQRTVDFGILRSRLKPVAVIFGIYLVIVLATGQPRIWMDDLRYGRPRTMQVNGWVGHNEATGEQTHFIAMNLNRRVVVVEMPGGDPGKAQILQGPYLFGANEDLTPVRLELKDVNNDNKQDLVINVKNEEIIYINSGDTFRLMTTAERQQLGNAH